MTELDRRTGSAEELAARQAFDVEQRIKATVILIRGSWVTLAGDLFQFNEQQMWRDLGYGSFEEWLAGPEIDLGRRWVYELISMWRQLVVGAGAEPERLRALEPSKVQEVLPAVRRQQVTLEVALSDVETLSRSDLRERYGSGGAGTTTTATGSAPDTKTSYSAGAEPSMVRCPTCGSRVREEELSA